MDFGLLHGLTFLRSALVFSGVGNLGEIVVFLFILVFVHCWRASKTQQFNVLDEDFLKFKLVSKLSSYVRDSKFIYNTLISLQIPLIFHRPLTRRCILTAKKSKYPLLKT